MGKHSFQTVSTNVKSHAQKDLASHKTHVKHIYNNYIRVYTGPYGPIWTHISGPEVNTRPESDGTTQCDAFFQGLCPGDIE